MSEVEIPKFFVRIHGKVMGPFAMNQLLSLKNRGRLHEDHEISSDRRQWYPANQLNGLFSQASSNVNAGVSSSINQDENSPVKSTQWFYTQGDDQTGPVSFAALRKLCRSGELTAQDLVWHEGLEDWIAVSEVEGLIEEGQRRQKNRDYSKLGDNFSESQGQTILWDALLNSVRQQMSVERLDAIIVGMTKSGGLAMTIGILAFVGVTLMQGIKSDSIQVVLWGLGAAGILSALKYSAVHLSFATDTLIRTTPNRLATPAFANVIAVALLSGGIGGAAIAIYYGLVSDELTEKLLFFGLAVEAILVFGFASYAALCPKWLNIHIDKNSSAGMEGIAVLSLLLKLLMRLSTMAFSIGAVLSALVFVAGLFCFIAGGEWIIAAFALTTVGGMHISGASLIPTAAYLVFIIGSIALDLGQSLISCSGRMSSD